MSMYILYKLCYYISVHFIKNKSKYVYIYILDYILITNLVIIITKINYFEDLGSL